MLRSTAMRCTWLALLLTTACSSEPCEVLFGTPNDQTGLDGSECRPSCGCGAESWTPRAWDEATLDALRAIAPLEPAAELARDPYVAEPPEPAAPGQVCAVHFEAAGYRLETFASAADAEDAGAYVTHEGACGLCSTLADLAVYAGTNDLTAPVRQCGLDSFGDGHEANVACLEALGFTRPCAQIWAYNTAHTRERCGPTCIRLLNAPYHTEDGALNACLQCDEVESGPVFKAIAGRTRRNSGLPNAMCRPCSEVPRIAHDYPL